MGIFVAFGILIELALLYHTFFSGICGSGGGGGGGGLRILTGVCLLIVPFLFLWLYKEVRTHDYNYFGLGLEGEPPLPSSHWFLKSRLHNPHFRRVPPIRGANRRRTVRIAPAPTAVTAPAATRKFSANSSETTGANITKKDYVTLTIDGRD